MPVINVDYRRRGIRLGLVAKRLESLRHLGCDLVPHCG